MAAWAASIHYLCPILAFIWYLLSSIAGTFTIRIIKDDEPPDRRRRPALILSGIVILTYVCCLRVTRPTYRLIVDADRPSDHRDLRFHCQSRRRETMVGLARLQCESSTVPNLVEHMLLKLSHTSPLMLDRRG